MARIKDADSAPPRPDLSVVIVSWNVRELLAQCIASLERWRGNHKLEIIVVDNASSDGTVEYLHRSAPQVHVVPLPSNVGFASANNVGFQIAKAPLVFILNPDTLIEEGTIRNLVACLHHDGSVGAVGPKIVFPSGVVQTACARRLPSLAWALFNAASLQRFPFGGDKLTRLLETPYDLEHAQDVEALSGAAMVVRTQILDNLGGFGGGFIHGGEDIDLCFRIGAAGWRIKYEPLARIIHFKAQSSRQDAIRARLATYVSVQLYFRRSFGTFHGAAYRAIVSVIEVPLMLIAGIARSLVRQQCPPDLRTRFRIASTVWAWRVDA